mgnify:FL=1
MSTSYGIGQDVTTDLFMGRDGRPARGRIVGYLAYLDTYDVRWDDDGRVGLVPVENLNPIQPKDP